MKTIKAVILTKSAMEKHGKKGACVTAYDPAENRFVRFVSDTQGSPIPYPVSDRFSVLDWVRVNVVRPCPMGPQTENLLVDVQSFFRIGPYIPGIEAIFQTAPPPHFPRFMDDYSYKLDSVESYDHSLELIRVTDLCIENKKGRGRASFSFVAGRQQFFRVTDMQFDIRKTHLKRWKIGNAYIVVSIPIEDYIKYGKAYGYFKFIAAIYPIP